MSGSHDLEASFCRSTIAEKRLHHFKRFQVICCRDGPSEGRKGPPIDVKEHAHGNSVPTKTIFALGILDQPPAAKRSHVQHLSRLPLAHLSEDGTCKGEDEYDGIRLGAIYAKCTRTPNLASRDSAPQKEKKQTSSSAIQTSITINP
jgi:hypothetical protein